MTEVLLKIQEKLKGANVFGTIDEDWGQLQYYSKQQPVKWPAALIYITGVNYSDIGQDKSRQPVHRQMGTASVTITIANLKITNTSGNAPLRQKQKAWEVWDLIERAHEVLQGLRPVGNATQMIRSGLRAVMRDDGVQEYKITYTFSVDNV